jgi:hypothetical protein
MHGWWWCASSTFQMHATRTQGLTDGVSFLYV